jgi:hypothetical protein
MAPFGFGGLILLLLPSSIGQQDLAGLIGHQMADERPAKGTLASPFGAIHEQNVSLPQPAGASIPPSSGFMLVGLAPGDSEFARVLAQRGLGESARVSDALVVDRSRKGDFAASRKGDRLIAAKPDQTRQAQVSRPASQDAPAEGEQREALRAQQPVEREPLPPLPSTGANAATVAQSAALQPAAENRDPAAPVLASPRPFGAEQSATDDAGSESGSKSQTSPAALDVDPLLRVSRLYFGSKPLGEKLAVIAPWAPGEEPRFEDGAATQVALAVDPLSSPQSLGGGSGFKLASLPPNDLEQGWDDPIVVAPVERADLPPIPGLIVKGGGGETVAPKGEVTGEDKRPMTPAERLKLDEKGRVKAEKCLAEAVYFEARGEEVLGQVAVAQVVLNRAFSGKYPSTVCGVVYQNSHRHLACQFTFACDGIRDVVREPDMWERAKKIAAEMLDGKLWLPEVGKATHYHATYVHPGWVSEMKKMHRLGVHIFYRPRAWGDGGEAPEWSDPATTQSVAKSL